MAGIKNIRDLYKKVGEKGLREVLSGEIRVTEKFDAYRFAFEKNPHDYKIYYYGKNGKAPLSKIDRTVNDLYEQAIAYFENLPVDIQRAIPVRHRFGFSWFPTNKPLQTTYERRPKSGLILTDITVRNREHDVTREIKESQLFERWARVFGTEANQPVYEGVLDEATVDKIIRSIETSEAPLEMLNESQVHTPGFLRGGIEALVFESANHLFKIDNTIEEERKAEKRSHLFDILLLDICEHLSSVNISAIKPVSLHTDEAYIEIVSEVFNDFVEKRGVDFLASGLERPKFLDKSGNFNRNWVKNPKTRAIIERDKKYEYLFTVFLTNLKKPKYPSGLLSEAVVNAFNAKIEDIGKIVEDDFSFLEFNTILREKHEEQIELQQKITPGFQPDVTKALLTLQTFFNRETPEIKGEPVEVVIANFATPTLQLMREIEALYKKSGKRVLLFHDSSLDPYQIGANTVDKILSRLVDEYHETLIGYYIMKNPTIHHVLQRCGDFHPVQITGFSKRINVYKMEIDGINATCGETPFKIRLNTLPQKLYTSVTQSLESGQQTRFKEATPTSLHPYWSEIKTVFDRHNYL